MAENLPFSVTSGPKSGIPPLAAARLQKWAVLLSGYDYDIVYKCLQSMQMQISSADSLVRPEMKRTLIQMNIMCLLQPSVAYL